jgi:hypothetical protein
MMLRTQATTSREVAEVLASREGPTIASTFTVGAGGHLAG